MSGIVSRFGFAGVVLGVIAVGAGAVGVKAVMDGMSSAPTAGAPVQGAPAAATTGGQRPGQAGRPGGDGVRVLTQTVVAKPLYDVVQALGTAQARESVTITSKITDVIESLRFDSGDRVRRGQVLVVLSSVEQQADLAEAKAQRDAAKREADRFTELGERGFAPTARVEETRAALDRAEARVSALEARIADRTIRAPFAGVIGLRTASPGALARPGEPIATLDDTSVIKLDFDVPEGQINFVRSGAQLEARTAALVGEVFTGRVQDVDTRVNPTSRTLRVRALLPNPDGKLKPGMLMTVSVRHNPRDALAVPEIALLERSDGLFVYRVDQAEGRQVVALAPVRVGRRVDGQAEVVAGLKSGDVVVVEGVQRIRPGQAVQTAAAPAASAPVEAPPTGRAPTAPARPVAAAPPKASAVAPTAQPPAAPKLIAPAPPATGAAN